MDEKYYENQIFKRENDTILISSENPLTQYFRQNSYNL